MRDAILLCKAAGINQPALRLCISQRQAEIDSRASSWFDLRKDVVAIKWHNRLTGTRLHVFTCAQAKLLQRVVNWAQMRLPTGEHLLHIALSSF